MSDTMKTVLVIDDSATTRSLIASVMAQLEQVRIVQAESGFEALKILPGSSFDLIVTDINMPDINGLEVIGFLKNHPRYNSIPIIIISTERTLKDRRKGMQLGADDYITKPFESKRLLESVRKLLHRAVESEAPDG